MRTTSITLPPPEVWAEIEARSQGEKGGGTRSEVIATALGRYFYGLSLARKALRALLSGPELAAVIDVCRGTIFEPQTVKWVTLSVQDALEDSLAEKWGIDGPALVDKLRGLSYTEAAALVDAVERYWRRVGQGEQPDPTTALDDESGQYSIN